jgi:hypothetical protein
MAITVIKPSDVGNYGSFGQELGQSLGEGFQGALRGLAQSKIAELLGKKQREQERQQQQQQQEQQRQAFEGVGYSPEQIQLLSQFDPQTQFKILQTYKPQGGNQGQQSMQPQEQSLQNMLGRQQGQPQDAVMQNLMKMLGGQQGMKQGGQSYEQQTMAPQQTNSPFNSQRGEAPFGGYETPQMKLQRELAQNKEESTQQRHIDKSNSKFNESVDLKAESAERQQHALNVMKELDDTGQLDKTGYVTALKRFGLDYDVLLKPGSSLFKKMGASFLQDLKSVFPGGKITNQEMDAWLAGVPHLLQTKEGRTQLYEVLGAANKGSDITQSVRDSIIERNGGKEPKNLRSLTLKEAKPHIDALQKKVVDDVRLRLKRFESLPSPYSVPKGEVLTNHTTKESKRNTGSGWKTIPYRSKKG